MRIALVLSALAIAGVAVSRGNAQSIGESELVASKPPAEDIFHDGIELPPPASPNDTCASATPISIGGSTIGTTVGAHADYDSGLEGCTGFAQAGADVAYKIILTSSQTITMQLSTSDVTFDASISLLGPGTAAVCNSIPITCLAGVDEAGFGGTESFTYSATASGTYYVVVDSYYTSPSGGAFTLKVTSP